MRSRFPDPRTAPADAPIAWGGDLEPATLVDAYRHGIFPWPGSDGTLWWWSPDPRAVFDLEAGLHVSRTLRRTLRRTRLQPRTDTVFADVVDACAERPATGTWITPALRDAYTALHRLGLAHSMEVWDDAGALVGGVYGVTLGATFMGESMFSRQTDASKVALVALVDHLRERGFRVFDAQVPTPHLASLGARSVPRAAFLDSLADAVGRDCRF